MDEELLLETQKSAIEVLESVIAKVKAGEVIEVIGVAVRADECYFVFGGECESRHKMAGMLLELAIEKLK